MSPDVGIVKMPPLWTPERVYAAYRIFLAAALLVLFMVTLPAPVVGQADPSLYFIAALCFLALTIISTLLIRPLARRFPHWAPMPPIVIDVVLLTLLLHASGGVRSNLGVLLMVTVAAANILLPGRGGLFVAALATLAIMFEQFWFSVQEAKTNPLHLTEPALLGVSFFATAIIIRLIAQRLATSEALAQTQQQAIERLEALNNKIVQRMRTGVLVLDERLNVVLANPSAEQFFTTAHSLTTGSPAPPRLRELYYHWRANPQQHRPSMQLSATGPSVLVRFAPLDVAPYRLTLVFLEDERQLVQQAQQLKLSSLGRMSATIAHEIRNPLSAINHAADLLADVERSGEDSRLVEIIRAHVLRVNRIIDDVLSLSRRPDSVAQRLPLRDLLKDLKQSLVDRDMDVDRIHIDESAPNIEVRFDPAQLEQVLLNLISNARLYGGEETEIWLSLGIDPAFNLPWLRVQDTGPGISGQVEANLFEPFFTTSREGTGLGLFICRELCEANQARIDFEPSETGACFVITFAHPDRVFQ